MLREWTKMMRRWGPVKAGAVVLMEWLGRRAAGREPGPEAVFPSGRCGASSMTVEGGVPVLHLFGTPREMGFAHGRLTADAFAVLKRMYLDKMFPTPASRQRAIARSHTLLAHTPDAYADEMQGFAAGAGLPLDDVLLCQTFLDVMRIVACSTFTVSAGRSAEGEPLFARNLDFPSLGIAHRYSLLTVFHPAGGRAFAAPGWPGMLGLLTGMNQDGLCVATMEVDTGLEHDRAMPYSLLYREVLSHCSTVGEAEAFLRSVPIGSSNNLMMMDAAGDATVAELSPAGVRFRKPVRGVLSSTNHFRHPDHAQAVQCPRRRRLDRAARECDRFDEGRLQRMLHGVSQGDLTIQSMILRPQSRRLQFAFGIPPTTLATYREIDLAEHFARTGLDEAKRCVA